MKIHDSRPALLIALVLLAATSQAMVPALALDTSTVKITVIEDRFHVEVYKIIHCTVDDVDEFQVAEDAFTTDPGIFRGGLEDSLTKAVSGKVPGAYIGSLQVDRVSFDDSSKKMYVELGFDVIGAIKLSSGTTTYDLSWRCMKVDEKFAAVTNRDRVTIDASEVMGFDWSEEDLFEKSLTEWSISEGSSKTTLTRQGDYSIEAEAGDVDLRVKMTIQLPGTSLSIQDDKVTAQGAIVPVAAASEPWWYQWLFKWWLEPVKRLFGLK